LYDFGATLPLYSMRLKKLEALCLAELARVFEQQQSVFLPVEQAVLAQAVTVGLGKLGWKWWAPMKN
jgi:hypothetical protein